MTVKKAPISDSRNNIVTVFDHEGKPHEGYTITNAREMVRHCNWTLDPKEAASRREEPVPQHQHFNEGQPKPVETDVVKPTVPVWEDLTGIAKEDLRKAAAYLKIGEIDGRSSEKRIVAAIDTALDQRLTASGDFDGSDPLPQGAEAEVIAAHQAAAIARRRRAFGLEAKNAGLAFGDEATIASLIVAFGALTEAPKTE